MSTLELLQLQNEHKDNFFGKGEDNMTGYDIVDQEIRKYQEEYYERTNRWEEDFIVIFDYKYEWENEYEHMVEFCSVYDDITEWENDWWEGQRDIVVKKVVALSELYDIFVDITK